MAPASDLRSRVDRFIAELNDLIRKGALEAVQHALGMSGKRGPRRPLDSAKAARRDKRTKRRTKDFAG